MISLILPKLIRSVTLDGIWTFFYVSDHRIRRFFLTTTQGKSATFNRELAELTDSGVRNPALIRLETNLGRGESGATPFADAAPTYRPVIT